MRSPLIGRRHRPTKHHIRFGQRQSRRPTRDRASCLKTWEPRVGLQKWKFYRKTASRNRALRGVLIVRHPCGDRNSHGELSGQRRLRLTYCEWTKSTPGTTWWVVHLSVQLGFHPSQLVPIGVDVVHPQGTPFNMDQMAIQFVSRNMVRYKLYRGPTSWLGCTPFWSHSCVRQKL